MVRKMKCPYCGTNVNVSSHWTDATCQNCHQNFEIGVEIFELSEAEQKKEMELATQKIHAEEKAREERAIETKRRLRQMLHIPEPDPHANIKFEDEEEEKKAKQENADDDKKKKLIIIGGIAGIALIFIIVFVIMITSAMKKASSDQTASAPEAKQEQTTEVTQTAADDAISTSEVTSEAHDGGWVDGFSIDSNSSDGRYKIDLQSSDTGEQREVNVKPAVTDNNQSQDSTDQSISENKLPEDKNPESTSSNTSPAASIEEGNADMTPGQVGTDDKEVLNILFNGAE